jgi:hypothetical protein
MLKRFGVPALILLAATMFIRPTATFAQDGYYYGRDSYSYQRDRNANRHEAQEWRGQEHGDRRADDWRGRESRQWRDNEWRERGYRFDSTHRPDARYLGDRR